MRLLTIISFIMLIPLFQAQQWNSSRILHEIQKINTLGNVLYLAAHPDDENTRFISYCANEKKMHTGTTDSLDAAATPLGRPPRQQ